MSDREYFRWVFIVGLMIAALVAGALEAHAHTAEEITQFEEEWNAQLSELAEQANQTGGLSLHGIAHLIELRVDFEDRHPWHYSPEDAPDQPDRASQPTTSRTREAASRVEQWRPLVSEYFAASDVTRALCLIWHESRGNPAAKNPTSTATGLFQIIAFWEEAYQLDRLDPAQNVELASIIRSVQGWRAWSPYNRGLCR